MKVKSRTTRPQIQQNHTSMSLSIDAATRSIHPILMYHVCVLPGAGSRAAPGRHVQDQDLYEPQQGPWQQKCSGIPSGYRECTYNIYIHKERERD